MRIKNDFYRTPPAVTAALAQAIPPIVLQNLIYSRGVVDPCAGDGALLDALDALGVFAFGLDIEPQREDIAARDALDGAPWGSPFAVPSATIMNPPFALADRFIRRALDETPYFVCALLRLTFLEPTRNRRDLLELRPDALILAKRPRFRTDTRGTDSATCAWFTWPGTGQWRVQQ